MPADPGRNENCQKVAFVGSPYAFPCWPSYTVGAEEEEEERHNYYLSINNNSINNKDEIIRDESAADHHVLESSLLSNTEYGDYTDYLKDLGDDSVNKDSFEKASSNLNIENLKFYRDSYFHDNDQSEEKKEKGDQEVTDNDFWDVGSDEEEDSIVVTLKRQSMGRGVTKRSQRMESAKRKLRDLEDHSLTDNFPTIIYFTM